MEIDPSELIRVSQHRLEKRPGRRIYISPALSHGTSLASLELVPS
jgi:hypothetical protein